MDTGRCGSGRGRRTARLARWGEGKGRRSAGTAERRTLRTSAMRTSTVFVLVYSLLVFQTVAFLSNYARFFSQLFFTQQPVSSTGYYTCALQSPVLRMSRTSWLGARLFDCCHIPSASDDRKTVQYFKSELPRRPIAHYIFNPSSRLFEQQRQLAIVCH